MHISLPWSRQQIIVVASLTQISKLYQMLGEKAAVQIHMTTGALKERAVNYGGRMYPSASHQVLAVFGSPRKALDWIEQIPTDLLAMESHNGQATFKPTAVIAFDCADTNEIEGMLHSTALTRLERLLWGRTDEVVLLDSVLAVIPDELKGRITRIVAPQELGSAWRIGVKEASIMSAIASQPRRADPSTAVSVSMAMPLGADVRHVLRLEMLDRKIELSGHDQPLIIGRNVADGMSIPDPRVSRVHARIEPRGDHFAVIDMSSNGTWVQFQNQPAVIELRQQECVLRGSGVISFGAEPSDFSAPTVGLTVAIPTGSGNTGFSSLGGDSMVTRQSPLPER
jgi:adenylate cyclase